jgi:oligopeptide/dipeptide ABC transporter ATP-binding protein
MNIIKYKNWYFALSLLVIVPGLISLLIWGLKLSIDFTGGSRITYIKTSQITQNDLNMVDNVFVEQKVGIVSEQLSGSSLVIRTKPIIDSVHQKITQEQAMERALELMNLVGIAESARRLNEYPHQLSGGMLQRVMIASALAVQPRLILADEPTTALDVTTQAEVMAILDTLRREHGVALVFITHDLELAAAVCDRTDVMYAGSIMEQQSSDALDHDPLHPYTAALIQARPSITSTSDRLAAIPGRPVSAFEAPRGCAFAPRCGFAISECTTGTPPLVAVGSGLSRCIRIDSIRGTLMPGEVSNG